MADAVHLLCDVGLAEGATALSEWRWLLGAEWSPLLVSAAGDVLLIESTGQIARRRIRCGQSILPERSGTHPFTGDMHLQLKDVRDGESVDVQFVDR